MRISPFTYKFAFSLLIGSIIYISACQTTSSIDDSESEDINSIRYPLVEEVLWTHFQQFEKEATARGYIIDLNALEITGSIEDIPEDGVAGICVYGTHDHDVTIDITFWNNSSQLTREFVVFHELGHCVLLQGHREVSDNQGNCLSLMNSGTSGCRVAYNHNNRDYYINELFEAIE